MIKNKYQNKLLFLSIIMISGILCGSIMNKILNIQIFDVNLLEKIINYDEFTYEYFTLLFTNNLILYLIILLCSTSFLGLILISFIHFIKGLMIGYNIMLMLVLYQIKGILGIMIILVPFYLLEVISIMIISCSGISLSMKWINLILKQKRIKFKLWYSKMLNEFIISIIILIIHCMIQVFVMIDVCKWFYFL